MAYTTPIFVGVAYGVDLGTTVLATGKNANAIGSITSNNPNATKLSPGDAATYNFNDGQSINQTFSGTYVGDYVVNGNGYPVFNSGGSYYVLGQTATNATYPYTQSSYPPCYVTGTRISTNRGEIAVEDLRVGDIAVTASGAHRPIRWIGAQLTHCARHPHPQQFMPVRFRAGALGEGRPSRDLVVSPGHAIAFDVVGEVLIPASVLVNGSTIVREDVDSVTYWHVELDSHDLLIAEGQPAESYLDMGNRTFFGDLPVIGRVVSPDGDPALRTHADFCRPFYQEGQLVEVVRAQLAARAKSLGWRLEARSLDDLHLLVDGMRVEPQVRGFMARFAVPADACDVWLVSPTSIPASVCNDSDFRTLGACLTSLDLDDGFGACRAIAIDDPQLCVGFHEIERDAAATWRWTAGSARLPTSLWADIEGEWFLRVGLAGPMLPRWIAPAAARHGVAQLMLVG